MKIAGIAVISMALWGAARMPVFADLRAAPSVAPAQVEASPGKAEASALPFPEGTFEKAGADGKMPLGWSAPDWALSGFSLVEEQGARFLRLSWVHAGHLTARCDVKVDPRWSRLKFSLRVRLRELKLKDGNTGGFMCRATFLDADGKTVKHLDTSAADRVTDWFTMSAEGEVPANATHLRFSPGFFDACGSADMDDLTIEATWKGEAPTPLPGVEAVPIGAKAAPGAAATGAAKATTPTPGAGGLIVHQSRLDQAGPDGKLPADWSAPDWALSGFSLVEEGGRKFLRMSWAHIGYLAPEHTVKLDPRWRTVTLGLRVRIGDIRLKDGNQGAFEFRYSFLDDGGTILGGRDWPKADRVTDWATLSAETAVPAGATQVRFSPGFFSACGTVDMADLTIEIAPPPPKPVPPALAASDPEWLAAPVEQRTDQRGEIVLSGVWAFMPATPVAAAADEAAWGRIRVPGSWKSFSDKGLTFPGVVRKGQGNVWENVNLSALDRVWYSRTVPIPANWKGRAVTLELTRVSTSALVFVNGQECGEIGPTYGEVEVTKAVEPGRDALIQVLVVSALDRPEYTASQGAAAGQVMKVLARLKTCGINGDAILRSRPSGAHVSDVFVQPSTRQKKLNLDVELTGVKQAGPLEISAELVDEKGNVEKTFAGKAEAKAEAVQTLRVGWEWDNPRLWDYRQPNLYVLRLTVKGQGIEDCYAQSFGFREFWIEGRKFMLNGTEFRIRPRMAGDCLGIPEMIEAQLDSNLAMGFNLQQFWPSYTLAPGSPFFQEVAAAIADRKGYPLSGIALHMYEAASYDWSKPVGQEQYRRDMLREMRRLRNHPSILLWGSTANYFGHQQDQNPRFLGRQDWIPASDLEGGYCGRTMARKVVELIKEADPTRPVYFHHGTHVADFPTVNTYLNLIPLQEREEWLSQWAKDAPLPWLAVEFGPPLDITLMRSRKNHSAVHSERLFSEYLAIYFGIDAYRREPDKYWRSHREQYNDGSNARPNAMKIPLDLWPAKSYIHWYLPLREKDGGIDPDRYNPVYGDFMTLFTRNTHRSWRTQGCSSLPIPWMFQRNLWSYEGDDKDRVKLPEFKPGRLGAWCASVPQSAVAMVAEKPCRLFPQAQAMQEANSDTLAWISGAQLDFTAKDHNFYAGRRLEKAAALLNDMRAPQKYAFDWSVSVDGKVVKEGKAEGRIEVGQTLFAPIVADLPATLAQDKADGEVRLVGVIGERKHEDRFAFRVFRKPASPPTQAVRIFDPEGKTAAMLKALGCQVEPWDGKATDRVVVIGREALSKGNPLPAPLLPFLESGGRCILFAQDPRWTESALGVRVAKHMSRRVFPVSASHPVTRGLDAEDLRDWGGASTLIEAYPDYGTANDLPSYGWHWGNRGALTSGAVEKPHRAGWRPILECEFDLAYSPLLEIDLGKGRLIWCTLDLEDYVGKDPVADNLATRLLDYAASAQIPSRPAHVVFLGAEGEAAALRAAGFTVEPTSELPADGLAVIGPSAAVDEAKLLAFLQQGGRALFLARSAAQAALGVTLENAPDLGRAPDLPDWPELAGLSASDLRARTPYEAWIVKSGAEVAAGGLFARKAVGQGVALFCQIDPLRFDTEQEPYFRFTRWRHTRALAQVLANLGAGLALDPFVALGRSPVDRLSIAGSWRVKAFGLVPGTKNIAQRIALAPLSEEATAAVATGADDSAWDQAAVPGMWSGFTEMDGEAVFRTRVSIPPEWAGRDLTLSLGAVDDFDVTFWNGEKVAEGEGWNKPRTYTVPEKLVKVGVNILAVRVFDNYLGGGFGAQSPGEMFVAPRERKSEDLGGYYDPDYRTDFEFGDDPYRYWRW